jgi:hypothetical protein
MCVKQPAARGRIFTYVRYLDALERRHRTTTPKGAFKMASPRYTNLTPANIAAANAAANAFAIRLNERESRLVMRDALASDA